MDAEAEKAGFQLLGVTTLGQDVLFTRKPVRSLAELRAQRLWRWDGDDIGIATARAMGLERRADAGARGDGGDGGAGGSTASWPSRRRRWPSSGRRARAT